MTTEHVEEAEFDLKPRNLHDLYKQLEKYHAGRIADQARWDAKYYQDVGWARAHVPNDIKLFKSSLATDMVDDIADEIRTDEPVITFTPIKDTKETRAHASLMEVWASETMDFDRRHGEVDPYLQSSVDTPLRGEGIIKQLHNPMRPPEPIRAEFDSADEFDTAHRAWESKIADYNPLLPARIIDPLNIFLPPNSRAPFPYLIEYQKRTTVDMIRDYPGWRGRLQNVLPGGKQLSRKDMDDPTREVVWLEYWSPDWYIVEADGVRIFDEPNPYGVVPYWHEYSGLGRVDRNAGPERKAIGILGKVEGEIEGDVMLRTITFAAATQYVFPRIKAPEDRVREVQEAMAQRAVIPYDRELGPNSIQWLDSPALKPDVSLALGQIQDAIARRVPPSSSGAPTNAQSGVQEALRIGRGTKSTTNIVEAVNNLATGILVIKAKIMHSLGLEVTLKSGKTLKAEDFKEPNFNVTFNAFDPVEDTRRQQNGLTLMREGAITKRTFRSQYISRIIEDPEDEEIQEGLEASWIAWLQSPEFQQWAVRQHMADQGVQLQEEAETSPAAASALGTSDPQREQDLALLEQLAPTTPLNQPLNGANNIAAGAFGA